jgi:hypothetical protein
MIRYFLARRDWVGLLTVTTGYTFAAAALLALPFLVVTR